MSSYTTFIKGTTISADDMNNNFNHIGAGTWTPYSGATLTTDTSALLDLGSQTVRWDTMYCNNINLDGELTQAFNLIAEVTLSSTASAIEFDGLNGDQDGIWLIKGMIVATIGVAEVRCFINGDSSSSNYGRQALFGKDSAVSAVRNTTRDGLSLVSTDGETATSIVFNFEMLSYIKTGNERVFLLDGLESGSGTYVQQISARGLIWNNTSDTITTLKIVNSGVDKFIAGTNVQVWAKVSTITTRSITTTTS